MKVKAAAFAALCAVFIVVFGSAVIAKEPQKIQKPTLIGFAAMAEKLEREIGPVLDMELILHKGEPIYKADVLIKDERVRVHANALTGKEIERGTPRMLWDGQARIIDEYNLAHERKPVTHKSETGETLITLERAKEIALKRVGGGTIKKIEFEREKGRPIYEVKVEYGLKEHEVTMDASNGTIIRYEVEKR